MVHVQVRAAPLSAQPIEDHDVDRPIRVNLGSDDEEWIDEATRGGQSHRSSNIAQVSAPNGRYSGTPRKRRKALRTAGSRSPKVLSSFQLASAVSQPVPEVSKEIPRVLRTTPPPPPPPIELLRKDEIVYHILTGIKWGIGYAYSIVRPAVLFLRFPLTIILVLFLIAFILNRVSSAISSALSPLCYIPGLSFTPMCRWITDAPSSPPSKNILWADYPTLMEVQSKTFNQLVDESVGSTSLSLDIKKTEIATADLVALVRLSDLASRESLANTLTEFIQDAKTTGRSLHRLESKMNGAMDSIMAMNDFALHSIEDAQAKHESAAGLLTLWKPKKVREQIIKETFADSMYITSEHLARLILELEVNHENLENLEEKLNTLRDIVAQEDKTVAEATDELLESLWTMLGGNRKDLCNFARNLKMLRDLAAYREQALARVVAALHTLQGASQDMEDMRERVAAPNLAGSKIPLEVHMKSIKHGLDRLKEGRFRGRKMEEAALRQALD